MGKRFLCGYLDFFIEIDFHLFFRQQLMLLFRLFVLSLSNDNLFYQMITKEAKVRSATARYEQLTRILGKRYIKPEIESSFDFIVIASKGVSSQIIANFRKHFNIPRDFTAELLQVSEPTIYRWVRSNKKLERNYSVLLFELTDLFLFGSDVFGNQENLFKWLDIPNVVLGGLTPKKILEVPGGIAKIKDLLGRIESGVYS